MANNIEHLARKFEAQLAQKVAAKRGTKMNAKKIQKELEKARKEYKECRSKLIGLESELERIEGQIQDSRDGQRSSRTKMFKMREVLQNMDLADSNYAIFYDNDASDVGYIVDGEENYLDMTDEGEVSLIPMKTHRSDQRRLKKEEVEADDTFTSIDGDDESYEEPEPEDEDECEDEDEDEDDDNSSDDFDFIMHPNLRFID